MLSYFHMSEVFWKFSCSISQVFIIANMGTQEKNISQTVSEGKPQYYFLN